MTDKFDGLFKRDNSIHTPEKLKELQAYPLEEKIQITAARIMEFVQSAGGPDNVVVSYSGGKDSTVLLHICRTLYPTIRAVYSDTGLEYPEVRLMAKNAGADIVRPKMSFPEVITQYGYPIIGKEVAEAIYYARRVRNAPEERDASHQVGSAKNCTASALNLTAIRKRQEFEGTRLAND